jgi:AbrB family looped-hinge helix DNA binding protein
MAELATTKMSSRGQVVIPETVRTRLGLRAGVRFVVVGSPGVVVLKMITPPDLAEFDGLVADARRQARRVRLKLTDVGRAVREARKKR